MSHDEMFEAALESDEYGHETGEFGENEYENEFASGEFGESEFAGERDEFGELFEQEFGESGEAESEFAGESGESGELQEADEIALASELLEVSNEEELDQFLGKLLRKVGGVAKGILATPAGGALKGLLRSAARRGLPMLGRAVGGYFGGAGGARIGGQLAGAAGKAFGLELEGMSNEDQEFEVSRRFIRLATTAARRLPPRATPAQARSTFLSVARRMAPGLVRNFGQGLGQGLVGGSRPYYRRRRPNGQWQQQPQYPQQQQPNVPYMPPSYGGNGGGITGGGRWVRRGNRIVLFGV